MSCMCGDLYCHSCGPAQGNNWCQNCGAEPDQEHDDAKCAAEIDAADDAQYEAWKWEDEHADEIRRAIGG